MNDDMKLRKDGLMVKNTYIEDNLIKERDVKIGNITYKITSIFDTKSKKTIIDKVGKLIEKEVLNSKYQ